MHESGELLMELFISLSFRRDVSLKKDDVDAVLWISDQHRL